MEKQQSNEQVSSPREKNIRVEQEKAISMNQFLG